MPDIVSPATRSRMMSGIRGKDTAPELFLRRALHRLGFRYRLHVSGLPGKPDMVFSSRNAVIEVHGCFWHGHDCPLFKWPVSRADFWRTKIQGNRERDQFNLRLLQEQGWRVLTLWECALKGKGRRSPEELLDLIAEWLSNGRTCMELKG